MDEAAAEKIWISTARSETYLSHPAHQLFALCRCIYLVPAEVLARARAEIAVLRLDLTPPPRDPGPYPNHGGWNHFPPQGRPFPHRIEHDPSDSPGEVVVV